VFDYNGRLHQIEGTSLSSGNDATADAIRLAQSPIFTGGASNRSPDEIRAARAACRGAGAPEFAGVPGAATTDGAAVAETHELLMEDLDRDGIGTKTRPGSRCRAPLKRRAPNRVTVSNIDRLGSITWLPRCWTR
jgi:hypothetical protein